MKYGVGPEEQLCRRIHRLEVSLGADRQDGIGQILDDLGKPSGGLGMFGFEACGDKPEITLPECA